MYNCLVFITTFSLFAAARIHRTEERIVGGSHIPIEDVPWQVALLNDGDQWCGGSILSEWVILTAAHCVGPRIIETLTVRAGSSDWSSGGQEVGVAMYKSHDDYVEDDDSNDIAVLFLQTPLELGRNVMPIPLAEITPEAGTEALVTGWGETNDTSEDTRYLRGANVFIEDHLECSQALANVRKVFTQDNICAAASGKDSCQGDSGGPLVDVNKGELIGVVSWGLDCADPRYPGVYADVAYFKDWIREVVSNSMIRS